MTSIVDSGRTMLCPSYSGAYTNWHFKIRRWFPNINIFISPPCWHSSYFMCSFHCFRKLCPCLLNITAGGIPSYSTCVQSLLNISNKVPPYTKLSPSAFTRRTSGHSMWTLRAVNLFLPAATSVLPLTKHPTYSSASQPSKAVPWPRRSAPGFSTRRQRAWFFL